MNVTIENYLMQFDPAEKIKSMKEAIIKKAASLHTALQEHVGNWTVSFNDPVKIGILMMLVFFGVFGVWAAIAPLNSAAIAPGQVVLHASNKIIQHLEGGIISSINVKDGQQVKEGQQLMVLNKTAADSNLNLLYNQLHTQVAIEERLQAQQLNKRSLQFDHELLRDTSDPGIKEIIAIQEQLFDSYKQTVIYRLDILQKQIAQLNNEIKGLMAQKAAGQEQLTLLNKEEEIVSQLVDAGHETLPRLFELQRKIISVKGELGNYASSIAKVKQTINQTRLEIMDFKNEKQKEISAQLGETQLSINELKAQIVAAEDIKQRLVIKAPHAGIVTNLKYHTIGGVVPPHSEVMTIVPQDDELILETKLSLQDIDVVHIGLKAKIRLQAYKSRYTPMLEGEVIYISPDQLIDPATGIPHYLVRVKVNHLKDGNQYLDNGTHIELYPGMIAEVFIVTGKRTFLQYLLDPIQKTIGRAFKEE